MALEFTAHSPEVAPPTGHLADKVASVSVTADVPFNVAVRVDAP